jgi:hypothetical protein
MNNLLSKLTLLFPKSPSWETITCLAIQQNPRILRERKFRYCSQVPAAESYTEIIHMNSVHAHPHTISPEISF